MGKNTGTNTCPVCAAEMRPGIVKWHMVCPTCGYESADLVSTINAKSIVSALDEHAREVSLKSVRDVNFSVLTQILKQLKPLGGALLDVGCAHGWFLDKTKDFFRSSGVEPDESIFNATKARGLEVAHGYFPQALLPDSKFDIIAFNDVLEHIPNVEDALMAGKEHLNTDGLLLINLPSSNGFFYRLSKLLARVGICGFFDRMWQKGMPSPHVHYFNQKNLSELLGKQRFEVVQTGALDVLHAKGLYTRLAYSKVNSVAKNVLLYVMLMLSLPILKLFPSDIQYVIARVDTPSGLNSAA
jgi:2-polyprenyl-3-methyl-5-hydroxy-6-metoxy-1,4-benzoquinol methylase